MASHFFALMRRVGPLHLVVRLGEDAMSCTALFPVVHLAVLAPSSLVLDIDEGALGPTWVAVAAQGLEQRIEDAQLRGAPEALLAQIVAAGVSGTEIARHMIKAERSLEELVRHDALTGLLTRRELELRFSQERSRAQRNHTPLSLILMDVDVTDEAPLSTRDPHGALRSAAQMLRNELRGHDLAARFDGVGLAALLPGAGALEATSVARRLGVAAMRKGLSLSMGVSAFPDDTDHPDDLVPFAERNLNEARTAGGGRACLEPGGDALIFGEEEDAPREDEPG